MTRTAFPAFLALACYGILGGLMGSLILQLPGCKGTAHVNDPQERMDDAQRSLDKVVPRTEKIDDHAEAIEKRTPKRSLLDIVRDLQGIKFQTEAIREDVSDGTQALTEASAKNDAQQKELATVAKDRDAWKVKANSLGRQIATLGSALGLALLAGGVVAFIYGHKWGKALAIGAVVIITGSIAIGMFDKWIGIGGLIGGTLILGVYLWRTIHVKSKAIPELVSTIEVAKQVMSPTQRKGIVGDGALRGQADMIQSKSTRREVKITRNKAGELGKVRMAKTEEKGGLGRSRQSSRYTRSARRFGVGDPVRRLASMVGMG